MDDAASDVLGGTEEEGGSDFLLPLPSFFCASASFAPRGWGVEEEGALLAAPPDFFG